MQSEPRWLPLDEVVATNAEMVEATGEPHLIRDLGLLESACDVPRNQWGYGGVTDIPTLATALLFAICRNHPFMQGNKRTGFMAALAFMELNGWEAPAELDSDDLAEKVVAVIKGEEDEAAVASLFRTTVE